LKNQYILEFLHSEILDKDKEAEGLVPGLYLLLELAVGGDLFDKIGMSSLPACAPGRLTKERLMLVYRRNLPNSTLPNYALEW
jgi:hypothetical protein